MNYELFQALNGLAGRMDTVDDPMELAARGLIFPVFAVAAALLAHALWQRRIRPVVQVGAALALAFTAAQVVSHLSTEVRPFQTHHVHQLIPHETGGSLPSDHATAAFTIAAAVGWFLHRRWGITLFVTATIIGVARIWVGVHYPGDVLAALAIALGSVLVVEAASRLVRPRVGSSASCTP